MHHPASNDDTEEAVVPGVTTLIGILLTGLLYLVLPANLTIGPNWLLLVVEGVFVVLLFIDVLTAWNLSHSDILPQAHSNKSSTLTLALTLVGVVFAFVVTRFV